MAPPPAQNPQLLTSCEYASRVIQSDRKSTRLNSSHLVISYAVFCLKKKKNRQKNMHELPYKDLHIPQQRRRHAAPPLVERRDTVAPADDPTNNSVATAPSMMRYHTK